MQETSRSLLKGSSRWVGIWQAATRSWTGMGSAQVKLDYGMLPLTPDASHSPMNAAKKLRYRTSYTSWCYNTDMRTRGRVRVSPKGPTLVYFFEMRGLLVLWRRKYS